MKLLKLQSESRKLVLECRNQDRIFQSEVFEEAWNKSTSKQKDEVVGWLRSPNVNFIKQWVKEINESGFYKLTMKELRRLASYCRIPKYSRLLKDQLIKELEDHDPKKTIEGNEAVTETIRDTC